MRTPHSLHFSVLPTFSSSKLSPAVKADKADKAVKAVKLPLVSAGR